jgi:hypothetical protein
VIAMLNALGHPRTGHTEPALETKEV